MSNNREVFYYCTCNKDRCDGIRGEKEIHGYRLVIVNMKGICTNCGYYAVASDKIIDDDKLISHVTREIKEYVEMPVVGGLSLKYMKAKKQRSLNEN